MFNNYPELDWFLLSWTISLNWYEWYYPQILLKLHSFLVWAMLWTCGVLLYLILVCGRITIWKTWGCLTFYVEMWLVVSMQWYLALQFSNWCWYNIWWCVLSVVHEVKRVVWLLFVLLNVNPWYLVVSLVQNEPKPNVLLVEFHLQSTGSIFDQCCLFLFGNKPSWCKHCMCIGNCHIGSGRRYVLVIYLVVLQLLQGSSCQHSSSLGWFLSMSISVYWGQSPLSFCWESIKQVSFRMTRCKSPSKYHWSNTAQHRIDFWRFICILKWVMYN